MNKYLFILFVSIITNAFWNSSVQAQACGEGIFTFKFYILNGKESANINYEILTVNMDSINSISPKLHYDLNIGEIIDSKYVRNIADALEITKLEKALAVGNNKKKGEVNDGVINFKTLELAYYPCILHLSSNKKDIYILANLVGGCNRTTAILWSENPQLVRSF